LKISLWIVTYRNPVDLHNNLTSLFQNVGSHNLSVNVINNHSSFELAFEWLGKVKIWHNVLRSDQSLGHLARNWNQAIIQGFGSLNDPKNQMVVLCQDDVIWQPDWLEQLLYLSQYYNLISQGVGDAVVAIQPSAVKKIGL
jgi:GT2 family glycosyltransferase